jgi:hypothetical protein
MLWTKDTENRLAAIASSLNEKFACLLSSFCHDALDSSRFDGPMLETPKPNSRLVDEP